MFSIPYYLYRCMTHFTIHAPVTCSLNARALWYMRIYSLLVMFYLPGVVYKAYIFSSGRQSSRCLSIEQRYKRP